MGPSKDNGPRTYHNHCSNIYHRASGDQKVPQYGPSGSLIYQASRGSAFSDCVRCQSAVKQAETKVQDHLRPRRVHHASVKLGGESEIQVDDGNHLYFVNKTDIREVVKIVLDTFQQEAAYQDSIKRENISDKNPSQSSPMLLEFDKKRNSITPRLSAVAEPATTISVPKTFFAHTKWNSTELSAGYLKDDLSTTTTILSRGSVSEIVWSENVSSGANRPSRSRSSVKASDKPSNHKRIQRQPISKSAQFQGTLTPEETTTRYLTNRLESLSSNLSFQKRISRSTDEESNITSFPELRPRHCTNDWLNPPAEIEQLTQAPTSDLYRRGVDAHSGRAPASPEAAWQAPQPIAIPCDDSIFDKDPFYCTNLYLHERRATNGSTSTGKIRPGSSISSSAYQRRSSQVPLCYDSPWDSQEGFIPRILEKLRRNTQYDLSQQAYPRPDENVWSAERRKSPSPEAGTDANVRSRDSIVKERTLKPPTADNLGIYEALTGSKMVVGRKRHDTCSEDNQPHVCENDMDHTKCSIRVPVI
ncbi:hypothetical protein E5D57_006549 [Metarhizium anisopliae]|nr:hypothetical protein E5D57_006549 [Metarhizium anisopliae]